ncbi:MAG: hypothetical protein J07HX5_01359 [halophilic archaeon J07HX5]|nr:MAG: hypothetical protein J07HX5_01359 [halophilic archaeon J07HX5]
MFSEGVTADCEVVKMIVPPPPSAISAAAAFAQRNWPATRTSQAPARSSSVTERTPPPSVSVLDALLTSTSTWPNRSWICSNAAATATGSEISVGTASAVPGSVSVICAAVVSR